MKYDQIHPYSHQTIQVGIYPTLNSGHDEEDDDDDDDDDCDCDDCYSIY